VIRRAEQGDMEAVRDLFREYAAWVGGSICFTSFAREVAELPGGYSVILVAFDSNQLAGCVALREIGDGTGEIKRLYIRPAFQGKGLGRALLEQAIAESRAAAHRAVRLDTLPIMHRAITLYRTLGFQEIPPYSNNPPEANCFELAQPINCE
jgi:ribosomal protein S18 acetylase RimI-like enzyme